MRTAAWNALTSSMTWSDAARSISASGDCSLKLNAATAAAGAVLRPFGSRTIALRRQADGLKLSGDGETVLVIADDHRGGEFRARSRNAVSCSMVRSPPSAWSCLGCSARDTGHRRVPEPPLNSTGVMISAVLRSAAMRDILTSATALAVSACSRYHVVGAEQPVGERNARRPTERLSRDTSTSLRGLAVGPRAIEDDPAGELHDAGNQFGKLGDRHVLAGADIHRPFAGKMRSSNRPAHPRNRRHAGTRGAVYRCPTTTTSAEPSSFAFAILAISAGMTCEDSRSKLSFGP